MHAHVQVANRHPYSDINRGRLGQFYEQRPVDFSTQYGYGFPVRVFDRNSHVPQRGGDAPFPPGYVGHVSEKAQAVGETFGRITKAKVDSNMAPRPISPTWLSTSQKAYEAPRTQMAKLAAPPALVYQRPPPPTHYDSSIWQTTSQSSWHKPPASVYLPPRLRINEMDEFGRVMPTQRVVGLAELPRTKQPAPRI
jgi:hypothetical protein